MTTIELGGIAAILIWMCIEGYYFISSLWEHRRLRELLDRDEISFEEYWMKIEEYAQNQKLPHFFDNGIPKK